LHDVDEHIASCRRSSLNALIKDLDVEESDISTIRDFYNQYKKSYDTYPFVAIVLYFVFSSIRNTEKYDDKKNG